MFGPPGHAYVYLVYGLHCCMNVVTEPAGVGTAVLLRALEPVAHLAASASGPGRLCRAMDITLDDYGCDLCGRSLFIAESADAAPFAIVAGPRVGVAYAGEWAAKPLRFCIRGNPAVSRA